MCFGWPKTKILLYEMLNKNVFSLSSTFAKWSKMLISNIVLWSYYNLFDSYYHHDHPHLVTSLFSIKQSNVFPFFVDSDYEGILISFHW